MSTRLIGIEFELRVVVLIESELEPEFETVLESVVELVAVKDESELQL